MLKEPHPDLAAHVPGRHFDCIDFAIKANGPFKSVAGISNQLMALMSFSMSLLVFPIGGAGIIAQDQ
jgi:hypothetical protein